MRLTMLASGWLGAFGSVVQPELQRGGEGGGQGEEGEGVGAGAKGCGLARVAAFAERLNQRNAAKKGYVKLRSH